MCCGAGVLGCWLVAIGGTKFRLQVYLNFIVLKKINKLLRRHQRKITMILIIKNKTLEKHLHIKFTGVIVLTHWY
jgi:hypothetical protein